MVLTKDLVVVRILTIFSINSSEEEVASLAEGLEAEDRNSISILEAVNNNRANISSNKKNRRSNLFFLKTLT